MGTPSVSLRLTTPSEREPLEAVYVTPSITLAGAGFPIDKPPPVWYNRLKDGAGPGMALIIAFPPPPRKRRGRRPGVLTACFKDRPGQIPSRRIEPRGKGRGAEKGECHALARV